MQLSLDGFVAGPAGELDWMTWEWDDALKDYTWGITTPVDLILLGRKTAEGFMPHWASVVADPGHPEYAAGLKFHETPKIVFSRTLDTIEGNNANVLHEVSPATINELRRQPGGDIIAYGGAGFVSSLFTQDLIDEYYLFVNPVALGKGMSIFNSLSEKRNLKFMDARSFDCGIAVLVYRPA